MASLASSVQKASDVSQKLYNTIDRSDLKQINRQLDSIKVNVSKSKNASGQIDLNKALQKRAEMARASLILDQKLVASLQPSNSAMLNLIKNEQNKNSKHESTFDKRISKVILPTEENTDETEAMKNLKKLKNKVAAERQNRSNTMLRLNDSVAGFLLK